MDIVDLLLIIFFFFVSIFVKIFLRKNSSVFIEAEVSFCLSFVTIVQEIFLREDYVKFGVYRYIGKIRSILEQWNGSLNGEGKLNIRW